MTLRFEIFPADLDVTVDFYVRVLGFSVLRDQRAEPAGYVHLGRGAVRVGALRADPAGDRAARRPPTGVEVVLEVDDVAAERDRVAAAGWPIDTDLQARPWGLTDFRVLDPDGYYLRFTDRADIRQMADRKPPRVVADEAGTLHALLQYQRESLVRKVAGLDEAAARASPVASGTTLLWLIRHMAEAEITWVVRRFAGEDDAVPAGQPAPGGTLADAVGFYQRTWRRVDAIAFTRPSLDEPCRRPDADPPPSLRWVLTHLLEETARHAGHADILRELIDGRTGR